MAGNYPDPFTDTLGSSCTMTCSATLGPCYAPTLVRKDISASESGLPMRIAFLVVDESCKRGVYSDYEGGTTCNPGDEDLTAQDFFRGVQATDATGRADFDTCFPGWYSGRSIHVHVTVRVNEVEYVTSQLYFPDTLSDEIVANQPLYSERGPRDTTNSNDRFIAADAADDYTFQIAQMPDGALQVWKALVIRSSFDTPLCVTPGGQTAGGGGVGGRSAGGT
jgi:protocatechuate 3,4-dioxygenase beta subunit